MSSDESVYRAPESALERPVQGSARPLEAAMAGEYALDLGAILSEGWSRTNGAKGVILGATAITFAVSMVGNVITAFVASPESPVLFGLVSLVISLGTIAFNYAINAGTYLFAIKHVSDDPSASMEDVFSRLSMIGPITLLMMLYGIAIMVGLLLFVLPGIYIGVAGLLALPLMAERGTGIWESFETSRKAVHQQWFTVLAILLVTGIAISVGAVLTLGIGLIWLLPWGAMVFAILYREIFGYAGRG